MGLKTFDLRYPETLLILLCPLGPGVLQKCKVIRHSAPTNMLTNLTRPNHIKIIQSLYDPLPTLHISAYLCIVFFTSCRIFICAFQSLLAIGLAQHNTNSRSEENSSGNSHKTCQTLRWHSRVCLGMTQDWRTLEPCWSEDLNFADLVQ